MVNVRNIEALVALADERHFGRAAARLHLTQPGLTRRIQALEAEVGMRLVERSTRDVTLTDAATRFIPRAKDALERLAVAVRDMKAEASGLKGFLKVGYNRISLHGPFIQLVRTYREQFPDVQIDLLFMPSHHQAAEVEAGVLDVGFVVGDMPASLGQLVTDEEPLVAVLPQGHPLAGSDIPLSALANERFVFGSSEIWQTFLPIVKGACLAAGFAPNVAQEAGTSEALFGLVGAGAGVTLYTRGHGPSNGTVYVGLTDCKAVVQSIMVWRRTNTSPQLRAFLANARRFLAAARRSAEMHEAAPA